MARIKSAKKAHRVSERRAVFNIRTKRSHKEALKEMGSLIAAKKTKDAVALMPKFQEAIDKAVKEHIITKNTAARIKSRTSKRLSALA